MKYKKTYKFKCVRCGKKSQSVNSNKTTCQKCLIWSKPGIGQTDIFGGVVEK